MKNFALVIGAALLGFLFTSPASAQTAVAGAQSGSAAQAAAGSQAGSAAVIQQTFQGTPGVTRNIIGYENRQDTRATIRNTPDAYAPPVTGGTNPCARGASGGGSVAGFGLAIGGSWSDPECERRNLSALLHNQGQPVLAQEVLCETDTVRRARIRLARTGRAEPCADDIPAGTPVVAPAPVAAAPSPREIIAGGAQPVFVRPAWCETASVAERRRYVSTCG
jgi:hypothetical protein